MSTDESAPTVERVAVGVKPHVEGQGKALVSYGVVAGAWGAETS
jgi:hypothetical protein